MTRGTLSFDTLRTQLDSFTVPLHSPNGKHFVRVVQRDCLWGPKNGGNPRWSREPIMQWGTRQSQSIFRPTNDKSVMPTNWRPCRLPHSQSYNTPIATRLGLCSSLAHSCEDQRWPPEQGDIFKLNLEMSCTYYYYYTPRFNEVERGYPGITLSVCPSVDRIVSALYLQQYSSDPFHICASYQATSEGVSRVISVSKFKHLNFWRFF